jgi:proteasome component ECM29
MQHLQNWTRLDAAAGEDGRQARNDDEYTPWKASDPRNPLLLATSTCDILRSAQNRLSLILSPSFNRNKCIVRATSSKITVKMSASTEARELELVGKVEMRIALAKDDKLESILKPYLPPLLLKLASEHQSVRNKVNSIDRGSPRDMVMLTSFR